MRVSRFVPVLVAGAVFTASAAPAAAATPGVGTTVGSLEVLSLDVGELLDLDLLSDFAAANTDTDTDPAGAAAAIKALVVDAPLLLPEPVEVGILDVSSDGEEKTASNNSLDLADTPEDISGVLGGELLPAALSAALGEPGATSTSSGGVAALDILQGIAGLDTTELGIAANSLTEQADGGRHLVLDNLAVLELGDLLAGLGIPLDLLPLDTVVGLIDDLGLTDQLATALAALDLPVDLTTLLDLESLNAESLEDLIDGLNEIKAGELCVEVPLVVDLCEELAPVVDDVTDLLIPIATEALELVLEGLDTALLELKALDVTVITKATDSRDTSAADIIATLGGLTVAGVEIPEVDVAAAIDEATATLDSILATIDPVLEGLGLLDIGILEQDAGVTEDGDAITSQASFTGLRVDLAGLTDGVLDGVLAGLPVEDSIGSLLGEALGELPANPITDLLGDTDALSTSALSDGLSLRVASLGQTSTFTEVLNNTATPAAPAAPQLPQTGSNDALMLALAAIAAGGALGIRRVVRTKD